MVSDEGESYRFTESVATDSPAEEWMTKVDEAMKSTLSRLTKEGVYMYGCRPRFAVHS